MIITILALLIIIVATSISVYGAYLVSGKTNDERARGFYYWQWSNLAWVGTFFMGVAGFITPTVFTIQQGCALMTFIIYFLANRRGERNNGNIG